MLYNKRQYMFRSSIIYTIVCIAAAAAGALAAEVEPGFYFDYALFYPTSGDTVWVETYIAVPLGHLTPKVSADGSEDYNFNVGVRAERASDGAVIANRVVAKAARIGPGEGSAGRLSVSRLGFGVPPGDYVLNIGVGEPEGGNPTVDGVNLTVPPREGSISISGIELASSIAPVEEGTEGEFIRNGLSIIPNPTKLVSDSDPVLPIYYEVYGLPPLEGEDGGLVLRYDVSQLNGRRFVRVERVLEGAEGDIARADTLDLAGVPPGSYELVIRLEDTAGTEIARAAKRFIVYHKYSEEEAAELKGKFIPYSLEEEKQIRREISLIASEEEMAAFDALPPEEKPIFIDNFWQRRDPDPETQTNEFKNTFYERYYYVQQRYSIPFRDGVDTDMGRIYLKYGEPDQILSSPMGIRSEVDINTSTWQSEPFEAWEYFEPGGTNSQYILFVFLDFDGDGDYEIDSSTVPGYGRPIREN